MERREGAVVVAAHAGDLKEQKALYNEETAGIAQLVEHLICNQRVAGSTPVAGSKLPRSYVVFVPSPADSTLLLWSD